MTEEHKEELFQLCKELIMEVLGYDEIDMEDGSIEDEVNSEARDLFEKQYGEEY